MSDSEAIQDVRDAVSEGRPYSLTRLGDGEAIVLSFGPHTWLQDLAYLHGHWGAERVTLDAITEAQRDLAHAVAGADLVGVRNDLVDVALPDDILERSGTAIRQAVIEAFDLRSDEVDNLSALGARRLALLHRVLSRMQWSDDQKFCSAWIHWELLASGALDDILNDLDHVGLVTSRPEVEDLVAHRFDVKTAAVLVPDKSAETSRSGEHVPDLYRRMRSALTFPEGTVVLVGAGIPGKAYCQWLKERGCIALDIGSVFDAWVGKPSRPRVLESRFRVPGGNHVPVSLQLQVPGSGDRRLTPRWKPKRIVD